MIKICDKMIPDGGKSDLTDSAPSSKRVHADTPQFSLTLKTSERPLENDGGVGTSAAKVQP